MADDRDKGERPEDEEFKITVRDRRRVNVEGELRPVEDADAAAPPHEPTPEPPPAAPQEEAPQRKSEAAPRRGGGGALGGAAEARVRRQHLQDVSDEVAEADELPEEGGEDEPRRVTNVYEYVQVLASELAVWGLASLGLMAHPATRLVTTDLDQADFAVEAAEAMLQTLAASEKVEPEVVLGLYQSFVIQFGSVAAQLLNQPPQSRLGQLRNIRFCIDTADRFAKQLGAIIESRDETDEQAQLGEISRFLNELRLLYVQASGGGGIIG